MDKDYYKIMGLSQDATEKGIKLSYKRLARKYHPDLNKEADAEERFKEMGEAYEVLKDPVKRAEYDQYRELQKNRTKNPNQRTWHTDPKGSYQSHGTQFNDDFFESLFGHSRYQQQPMTGQDYQGKVTISLEEAFHGTTKSIQVPGEQNAHNSMQTLNVKIPKGVKSGQQIRLAGQGASGFNGGSRGDIYLTINVDKHSIFDVLDNDIYLTLPITPWEAALGATITVPTLSGKIDLKIPSCSQSGQKLRIKNRGLPGTAPGNQYVILKIVTPPATTEAATELYKKMAEVMPFNPRTTKGV